MRRDSATDAPIADGPSALRAALPAIFAAILLRIAVIAWLRPPAAWDGAIYAALAEGLAEGHGFVHWDGSGRATAFFPVGFPAAIAAVMAVGLRAVHAAYVVNVAASALTTASAAALAWTAGGVTAARRAAWFAALYPGAILWSAATMTETLQCAFITSALAVALWPAASSQSPGKSLAKSGSIGALLALAAYVRPQAIVLAPLFGALTQRSLGARLAHGTVTLFAALALIAPWTLRNARALDGPALVSTNGGSNLLIGTLPDARGGYRELTAADPCAEVRGERARDRCMTRVAVTRIQDQPLAWAALGARKVARTMAFEWAPVSYARSTVSARIPKPLGLALAAVCTLSWWWALFTFARFALRARGAAIEQQTLAWGVGASIASVALVHAAFIADDRYHLVLVGVLCASAAVESTNARNAYSSSRRPPSAPREDETSVARTTASR
jgi:hypothetical protein